MREEGGVALIDFFPNRFQKLYRFILYTDKPVILWLLQVCETTITCTTCVHMAVCMYTQSTPVCVCYTLKTVTSLRAPLKAVHCLCAGQCGVLWTLWSGCEALLQSDCKLLPPPPPPPPPPSLSLSLSHSLPLPPSPSPSLPLPPHCPLSSLLLKCCLTWLPSLHCVYRISPSEQ